jgi:DNA polymerase-3 subunit gamma/tau
MSYQVLARKWRPRGFGELVGQEHVVRALTNALDNDRLHHAYLFAGTRGVGKTTLARIVAKALNCEQGVSASPCGQCGSCREIDEGRFADLLEVDAASRTKVDQTRELLENVPYAPVRGRYKVYLIDEVHMFSTSSFNALLKTLEEPPPHVKFLLATTDPQKVPVTVLSRCLQFNLKRLPVEQICGQLEHVLDRERIVYDPGALSRLARSADGSMRDALSLMDQAIAFGGGAVREADVVAMLGVVAQDRVCLLLQALADGDGPALLSQVREMADLAPDFASALQELLGLLHRIAMCQALPGHAPGIDETDRDLADLARRMPPEDVQLFYQIGLIGQRDLPLAPDPRSGFEMVLLRMLTFRPVGTEPAATTAPEQSPERPETPSSATPLRPPQPAPLRPQAVSTAPAASVALAAPSDWHTLVAGLRLGGVASQLASHCELVSWDGSNLRLRLDPASRHMRVASSEQRLLEALRERLGAHIRLTITQEAPQTETPAQRQARQNEQRREQAQRSIREDPIVQGLEEHFGARVIPDSIAPLEE